MRRVIGLDGTFLKSTCKGTLLVATCQDGNYNCYPIAWGVVDSERDESWTWFLTQLKVAIGEPDGLVFISDRHPSIQKGVATIFLRATYGACYWHVRQNLRNRFKSKGANTLFNQAAEAYKLSEFRAKFAELEQRYPHVHEYLSNQVGVEKWARSMFAGERYNIMTTNIVEALNSTLKRAREYPLLLLLDSIVEKMVEWFNERREKAQNLTFPLTPECERRLRHVWGEAGTSAPTQINANEWVIRGGGYDAVVDLQQMTCTCKIFELEKLPCEHALRAAGEIGENKFYECCSIYYSASYWRIAYEESVYPVPSQSDWEIPDDIGEVVVLPPELKQQRKRGRPRTNIYCSSGELPKWKHKCTKCGEEGHYQKKCPQGMFERRDDQEPSRATQL